MGIDFRFINQRMEKLMKTEQKNTKKILISLIALVFVIAALFGMPG